MRAVMLDKVASVTKNCKLRKDVRVGDDFACRAGDVIAVRVLTSKSTYNTLELVSGRMSPLRPGDVIAGALGHRNALFGYEGVVPESLQVGDVIQILNLGGVLGICTSSNPVQGTPFDAEVLGQVLTFPEFGSRSGIAANIAEQSLTPRDFQPSKLPPVVAVVGSCMNSGKTEACLALVHHLARRGMRVAAGKATGVSLMRDTLAMEDAGAFRSLMFNDFGIVTTSPGDAVKAAKGILAGLAEDEPDVIVLELGDGLIGKYGVDSILSCSELAKSFSSVVLAANDPVAAWGGIELLKSRFSINATVITGPATDNAAGSDLIAHQTGVPAVNAKLQAAKFAEAAFPKAVVHG